MRGEITFSSANELMCQLERDVDERKSMNEGINKIYETSGV